MRSRARSMPERRPATRPARAVRPTSRRAALLRRLHRALRQITIATAGGVRAPGTSPSPEARPPASELERRIEYLEHEVTEVRGRVNALFFAVIAAALIDALTRVVLS